MYKEFYINKTSGTYAETLEAFGLAILINNILERSNVSDRKVTIADNSYMYVVSSNREITEDMLLKLRYFQIIKFIKKEASQEIPAGITDCFDYPANKALQDEYKEQFKQIEKLKGDEVKKLARKALNEAKLSEFGKKIDSEYDVYREIIKNPYSGFNSLFQNFHNYQESFSVLIKEVLDKYTEKSFSKRAFKLNDEKPTAQQLYNPNQGKGLNKSKANNASMGNIDSNWISETMKISGALKFMICQLVKDGSSYDL